jgi:LysM repeat protein
MKIMKMIGVVAGIHALFFLLLFAVPGCSSTAKAPVAHSTATKQDAPSDASAPVVAASTTPSADSSTPSIALTVPAPAAVPAQAEEGLAPAITFSPTRPNTPADAVLSTQPASDVVQANTYTVVSGDNLWTIAKKNHVKVAELATANNLNRTTGLRIGQKLLIPMVAGAAQPSATTDTSSAPVAAPVSHIATPASSSSTKYTVKSGESLGSIARKFHVRISEIALANSLSDPKSLHAGQVLVIPSAHLRKPSTAASAPANAPTRTPSVTIPTISAEAPVLSVPTEPAPAATEVPTIQIQPAPSN